MVEMSQAIRLTLERYGLTLKDVPTDVLREFCQITGAFYMDMKDELRRRDLLS